MLSSEVDSRVPGQPSNFLLASSCWTIFISFRWSFTRSWFFGLCVSAQVFLIQYLYEFAYRKKIITRILLWFLFLLYLFIQIYPWNLGSEGLFLISFTYMSWWNRCCVSIFLVVLSVHQVHVLMVFYLQLHVYSRRILG